MRFWRYALHYNGVGASMSRLFTNFSSNKLKNKIYENVRGSYRKSYPAIKREIKNFIAAELTDAFNKSPTVQSIQSGKLRSELGLTTPVEAIAAIIKKLIDGIVIQVNTTPDKLIQINVEVGRQDFLDVLSIGAAEQDWTSADGNVTLGPPLPWLEWLLIEGDNDIIKDYRVSKTKDGRSGLPGVMVEANKSWRVPREFSGVENSNFLTDIFDQVAKKVEKKLWQIVRPVLIRDF